jgi:hypothetical protein
MRVLETNKDCTLMNSSFLLFRIPASLCRDV